MLVFVLPVSRDVLDVDVSAPADGVADHKTLHQCGVLSSDSEMMKAATVFGVVAAKCADDEGVAEDVVAQVGELRDDSGVVLLFLLPGRLERPIPVLEGHRHIHDSDLLLWFIEDHQIRS